MSNNRCSTSTLRREQINEAHCYTLTKMSDFLEKEFTHRAEKCMKEIVEGHYVMGWMSYKQYSPIGWKPKDKPRGTYNSL